MDKKRYYDRFFSPKIMQRPTISKRILFNEVKRRVKKQIATTGKERLKLLDVGCGPGHLLRELAGEPRLELLGADITEEVLEELENHIPEADFLHLDFSRPQDMSPRYDIVTAVEVFEHIPRGEKKVFLSNCAACLKECGVLILTTPNKDRRNMIPVSFQNTQPVEDWVNPMELLELAGEYFRPLSIASCIWYFPMRWLDFLFKRLLYPFHMTLEQHLLRSTLLGGHIVFTATPKKTGNG